MDLTVYSETYELDRRDWLDSEHGTDATVPVTLDVSAFTEADHYPNGFLPSGLALGLITASSQYGPYDGAAADGTETLVGHLYAQVKVKAGATVVSGALLRHGFVKENKLPIAAGTAGSIDAAGKTDVKGLIGYRTA